MSLRRALASVAIMGALLLAACATCVTCTPTQRFLERVAVVHGKTIRFRVWLPRHYTKLRRWPVILFLHGSGEVGNDDQRQLTVGLPALLARNASRYPAVVVVPQCPDGYEWYGEGEEEALAALDAAVREFRGDPRRIYLTGISMGGAGVWYIARNPQRFAALVPVCGEVVRQPGDPFPNPLPPDLARILDRHDPYGALAAAIGKTPVWAFHGAEDSVIPPSQSRRMTAALRVAGGDVRYTEVPGIGHGVWDIAYDDPQLTEWLFRQRRTK